MDLVPNFNHSRSNKHNIPFVFLALAVALFAAVVQDDEQFEEIRSNAFITFTLTFCFSILSGAAAIALFVIPRKIELKANMVSHTEHSFTNFIKSLPNFFNINITEKLFVL